MFIFVEYEVHRGNTSLLISVMFTIKTALAVCSVRLYCEYARHFARAGGLRGIGLLHLCGY